MADLENSMLKRKGVAAIFLATTINMREDRGWKTGKTRNWIKGRQEHGVRELQIEDCAGYKEMMRKKQFLESSNMIEEHITPKQILLGIK